VIFFASFGFIVMAQLTKNIEDAVSRETRPLFGADIRVSPRSFSADSLVLRASGALLGMDYSYAERTEFSTTLLDKNGKTGLVNVVAYEGVYPQK
jgi:predicted lysophospholipase L1 biosynthesis ABC-type transport system permease subunit